LVCAHDLSPIVAARSSIRTNKTSIGIDMSTELPSNKSVARNNHHFYTSHLLRASAI
jgi:hypothetical protein